MQISIYPSDYWARIGIMSQMLGEFGCGLTRTDIIDTSVVETWGSEGFVRGGDHLL